MHPWQQRFSCTRGFGQGGQDSLHRRVRTLDSGVSGLMYGCCREFFVEMFGFLRMILGKNGNYFFSLF